jgi:3D (Asp-Asp-Asp) domain-containing protein
MVAVVIAVGVVALFARRYSRTHPTAPMGLMRLDAPINRSPAAMPKALWTHDLDAAGLEADTAGDAPAAEPLLTLPAATLPQPDHHPAAQDVHADADVVMFGNRRIRPVRAMRMVVTAYSPDERSCGRWADGITASGKSVWTNGMRLVAADTRLLPFGSIISVPGYNGGRPVPVLDRGGAIKGKRLDVLYPTHEIALRWGRKPLDITVWEYVD